jgi:hypothetical protein
VLTCSFPVGFQYFGGFQDRLGGFLTYSSSTRLNLHLETVSQQEGPEASKVLAASPLLRAVRGKASDFVNEARFQFALSTLNLLSPDIREGLSLVDMSATVRPVIDAVTSRRGPVIMNAAIPSIEVALSMPSGVAWTEGSPVIVPSRGLSDAIWRLGGVSIALRLIEVSKVCDGDYQFAEGD